MQTLEQANKRAADPRFAGPSRIYWLVYLLTGHRGLSADVTLETLVFPDDANPSFSAWMLAWSRRVFIAKALAAIRDDLAVSARRTASKPAEKAGLPPRNWTLDGDTSKVQLESALLAIDVFPRCALLLSVFEGMSLDDVAILLDGERDLVRKAQMIGLRELTRNLARIQGWTSTATKSDVITSEMRHA
jgi:DNA-directed RNA polymerase specialized sigma24 family protein